MKNEVMEVTERIERKILSLGELVATLPEPVGEKYWLVFAFSDGMVGTWLNYANTPREFISDFLNRRGGSVTELLELRQSNWPAGEDINIDVSQFKSMLVAAKLLTNRQEKESDWADQCTFDLESDFQAALRANIDQLEPAMKIVDAGKELATQTGRIDITAIDDEGTTVVIELKRDIALPESVAQILAYMAEVEQTFGKPVKGILLAADFHVRTVMAARWIPELELKKYAFRISGYSFEFHFESIG